MVANSNSDNISSTDRTRSGPVADSGGGGGGGSIPTNWDWAVIYNTPTTLAGYGITDAQPKDGDLTALAALTGTGYAMRTGTNTWTLVDLADVAETGNAFDVDFISSHGLTSIDVGSALDELKVLVDAAGGGGGSGDVVGPASATNLAIAIFDGTTGKLLKNTAATIAADGTLAIPVSVTGAGGGGITVSNASSGSSSKFNATNDAGASGGFGIFGSAFPIGTFQNNAVVFCDNGIVFLSDGGTPVSGTKTIDFVTGGYGNFPTMRVHGGNPGRLLLGSMTDDGVSILQVQDAAQHNPLRLGGGGSGIAHYGLLSFNASRVFASTLGVLGGDSTDPNNLYFVAPTAGSFQYFINGSVVTIIGSDITFQPTGMTKMLGADTTYSTPAAILVPTLSAGNNVFFALGRDNSTNNQFGFGFTYAGSGSAANSFGVWPAGAAAPIFKIEAGGNTTLNGQFFAPGSTTNSSIRAGSFELQSYAVNNAWLGENTYFDGANFVYRANGLAGLLYFESGGMEIRTAPSGLAGATATNTTRGVFINDGTVALGGTITNNLTGAGANLFISSTGDVALLGSLTTNGGLQTFGAPNSGGAGFRQVLVPN